MDALNIIHYNSDYLQSFSVSVEGRKLQHIHFGVVGHKSFSLTEKCRFLKQVKHCFAQKQCLNFEAARRLDSKQDMEDLGFWVED